MPHDPPAQATTSIRSTTLATSLAVQNVGWFLLKPALSEISPFWTIGAPAMERRGDRYRTRLRPAGRQTQSDRTGNRPKHVLVSGDTVTLSEAGLIVVFFVLYIAEQELSARPRSRP